MTKTNHAERISKEEAADHLEELAEQLRRENAQIEVGNKIVRLSPASELSYEIDVREESSFLRGKRESLEVELEWKPGE